MRILQGFFGSALGPILLALKPYIEQVALSLLERLLSARVSEYSATASTEYTGAGLRKLTTGPTEEELSRVRAALVEVVVETTALEQATRSQSEQPERGGFEPQSSASRTGGSESPGHHSG